MGFMVWGRQVLHWNLNLDGAPSWKPLPFLATLPYALTGHRLQQWLWVFTADAGGVAAVLLAGRLAWRLSPHVPGRDWARWVAALLAAFGLATMSGYLHLMLITNSDPLIVAVLLGGIDCHLSGRRRAALVLVWLAALGRPETWPLLLLYAAWTWLADPRARWLAVAAVLTIPALWFVIPGLTSRSWLSPGDLALGQATVIHGSKPVGVLERLRTLTELPVQIAVGASLVLLAVRRNRRALALLAAATLWTVVEIAFALHGWSAVQRYLIEPGAVLIVLAGAGVGTALAQGRLPLRLLSALAVLALVVWLVPYGRDNVRLARAEVHKAKRNALVLDRLSSVIAADGGAAAITRCGQPVSTLGFQSTLAWELGMNVGEVGFHPGRAIDSGKPIVFFKPRGTGWSVHATHSAPGAGGCARLDRYI